MPPSGVDASPKPSPPRPMVDFCSGASFAALNEGQYLNSGSEPTIKLCLVIEQFDNQDRHEFDDQMALEVHSMKEHLFTLLSKIQAIDGRLPGKYDLKNDSKMTSKFGHLI